MWVPNIENFSSFQLTGSSALDTTTVVENTDIRVVSVEVTTSIAVDNTDLFEITLVSNATVPPTEVLWYSKNLETISSLVYLPETSLLGMIGDGIKITWANSTSITYNITVNYVSRFTVWRMDGVWR